MGLPSSQKTQQVHQLKRRSDELRDLGRKSDDTLDDLKDLRRQRDTEKDAADELKA